MIFAVAVERLERAAIEYGKNPTKPRLKLLEAVRADLTNYRHAIAELEEVLRDWRALAGEVATPGMVVSARRLDGLTKALGLDG